MNLHQLVMFLFLIQLVSFCNLAQAQPPPQTSCGALQDSTRIISCHKLTKEFKRVRRSRTKLNALLSRAIAYRNFELPFPDLSDDVDLNRLDNPCCNMLEYASQNFIGRQCMCQLLQKSSDDKPFLEALKSADDPKFMNAVCKRTFKVARSTDTCSTPTIIKERLTDVSADGMCKHRLLELKNDVCHNPSDPICCYALNELAKDQDCTCKLSQRKIDRLTGDAFSFFQSLVDINDTRFSGCGNSIDTIRETRSRCLEKVDLSSLPADTVLSGCGASAQRIMEDTCEATVKNANQGTLPEGGGRELKGLLNFQRDIRDFNDQFPTETKEAIERVRNHTLSQAGSGDGMSLLDELENHESGGVAGFLAARFKLSSVSNFPNEEVNSFFKQGPAAENVTNFLQRLDKFWEDHKPQLQSLNCCNALTGLTLDKHCACLLKQRDASLNLGDPTFDFVDSIRNTNGILKEHCRQDFDLFTSTEHMCRTILKPVKVVIDNVKECWFGRGTRNGVECKTEERKRTLPSP